MARKITIPITDTPDCLLYYLVEYKLSGDVGYSFSGQYFATPIVLNNLADGTEYEFRVTRYCCDNVASTPVTFTMTTTPLDAPTGFGASQVTTNVVLDWDDDTGITFEAQRATNAGFTTGLTNIYTGTASTYTDLSPAPATYWYRVRSTESGSAASDWVVTSITVT